MLSIRVWHLTGELRPDDETKLCRDIIAAVVSIPELRLSEREVDCQMRYWHGDRIKEKVFIHVLFDLSHKSAAVLLEPLGQKLADLVKLQFPDRKIECTMNIPKVKCITCHA